MATYHQYSEIVAAYGYKLPPARPESLRVGLSLLYAAVGVALGTLTGTALAVVSTQPGAAAMRHFRFAHSATAALSALAANTNAYAIVSPSIHPLANLTIQHAAANESFRPVVGATLQPIVNASIRPLVSVSASVGVAAAAPAIHSVAAAPRAELSSVIHPFAPAPKAELSSVLKPALVRSATPLKPYLAHRQTAVKHVTMAILTVPISTIAISGTTVSTVGISDATQPITAAAMVAEAAQSTTALAAAPPTAPTILSFPTAAAQTGPDARPGAYYSEGDVTVADYDAVAGTIQTTDGKIFLIGPTVSESSATSWDDYRANVHYRCNQSGSCMLVRAGVVALNAKMI